ncbi:MAG: GyrI-like domain-containing protein [Methanomassiliicoccaceae archaeon]|nr:GyrI-like domain-containing protein [Methanomassiliicoccaceae archaeon]
MRIGLSEEISRLYGNTSRTPVLVDVPEMNFIMFDGTGRPDEKDFQISAEAVYTVSYILKFEIARKRLDIDHKVMPMEVRWCLDRTDGVSFSWTMMIMQPPFLTEAMFAEAVGMAIRKGKDIEHGRLRFEAYKEGPCVQAFHSGDYNRMNDTLQKMTQFAEENGLECEHDTHDIYLNDSRRTRTENLRTIMRIKVRPDNERSVPRHG